MSYNMPQSIPEQPQNNPEHLQQELQKMQARINLLESELDRLRPAKIDIRAQLHAFVILFSVLVFAIIPPAIVVADRWFHILLPDAMRDEWCQTDFLCRTALPSYFAIIFFCTFALFIFIFFQRYNSIIISENVLAYSKNLSVDHNQKQVGLYLIAASSVGFVVVVLSSLISSQYPGWSLILVWLTFLVGIFLRTFPLGAVMDFWKSNGEFWVSILLAHVSIVAVLVGYFSLPQIFWATVALLLLALANLWRFRQQVPFIFWLITLAMVVYSLNINGWWTAVIGDDFNFHDLAWRLAEKTSFFELGAVLFKADGAHGTHPYFSSFLQAIPMKFLGHDNFSWRFSSLYICSLGVGLFYLFCKTFISKHLSLIAAFLLAVSSYVMSFGKIGYNNLQALFVLNLVLAVTAWALRSRLYLAYACLGSALALCLYVYPAALYIVPLPFILLVAYYPPFNLEALKRWAVMVVVALAMIFPLLLQPVYWQAKVPGTLFNRADLLQSFSAIWNHFITNILYASYSFLYIPSESHYISSSYLDPLTSAFFMIGFCLLVFQMRRQRFAIFILISYIFFIIVVGASHDRETPPNTRMFLLLPFYVLIAAWGIKWIEEKARQAFSIREEVFFPFTAIFLVVIGGVNLYQAYPLSYIRYAGSQQTESLFIRISQHLHDAEPNTPKNYAIIVNESWGIDGLVEFQNVYSHLASAQIYQVRIDGPALSESSLPLLAERNTIIILTPWLDPNWVTSLDAPLRALGKTPCDISTSGGEKRFVLYHAPDLPQACYP